MKTWMLTLVLTTSSLAQAGGSDVGSAGGSAFSNMFVPLATCKISAQSEKDVTDQKSYRSGQFTLIGDIGQMVEGKAQAIIVSSDAQVGALSNTSERILKTGVGSAIIGEVDGLGLKKRSNSAVFVGKKVIYNNTYQWNDVITFQLKDGEVISATWSSIQKDGTSGDAATFHCK